MIPEAALIAGKVLLAMLALITLAEVLFRRPRARYPQAPARWQEGR